VAGSGRPDCGQRRAQPVRRPADPGDLTGHLAVARPDPDDEIIARHAEPERLAWMHANFTDHSRVTALGDADSYATRLFDYEHSGRDQVTWVIDRLRADPASRSATITTFQPHTDTTYIPCVSMLDFWLPDGAVELVVYAHSIDFCAKGYGNLIELASLQQHVAGALGLPTGRLLMVVKSAHVYETELGYIDLPGPISHLTPPAACASPSKAASSTPGGWDKRCTVLVWRSLSWRTCAGPGTCWTASTRGRWTSRRWRAPR
jgi:hypothetical protein